MIRVAACRKKGMHTADTQNFSRSHEQASQPGNEVQGETRHITRTEPTSRESRPIFVPSCKPPGAPHAAILRPADTAQLDGVVQHVMTATVPLSSSALPCGGTGWKVVFRTLWRWTCADTVGLSADKFLLLVSQRNIIRAFKFRFLRTHIDCFDPVL